MLSPKQRWQEVTTKTVSALNTGDKEKLATAKLETLPRMNANPVGAIDSI